MHTAQPGDGRRSRWVFGVSGLALLVVSVIMMASGAQPSRAQTVGPAQAPAQFQAQAQAQAQDSNSDSERLARSDRPGTPRVGPDARNHGQIALAGQVTPCR